MEKQKKKQKLSTKWRMPRRFEERKFHIFKLLLQYPADTMRKKKQEIMEKTEVSRTTLNNWLNLSIDDSGSISEKHLKTIAEILGVYPFTSLYNLVEPQKEN